MGKKTLFVLMVIAMTYFTIAAIAPRLANDIANGASNVLDWIAGEAND